MHKAKPRTSAMLAAAIAGGLIGYTLSLLGETLFAGFPGLRQLINALPFSLAVSLTAAGIVTGGLLAALLSRKGLRYSALEQGDHAKIPLREEQLQIAKDRVKTGDVDVHKEVLTDEKTITVPVSREELVVENDGPHPDGDGDMGDMRIPLSEERLDVDKDSVRLNDVSIYTKQHRDRKTVEETLKKEKLSLEKEGGAPVKDEEGRR
jgi:uncharacterized protein (TIGR02271 family)